MAGFGASANGYRSSHQGIHDQQACEKYGKAEEAARETAQICGEQEKQELAGSFGAER